VHPSGVDTSLLYDERSGLASSGLGRGDLAASAVHCDIAVDFGFGCDLAMWTAAAKAGWDVIAGDMHYDSDS